MKPEKTALVLFAHGARDARWALPLAKLKGDLERQQPGLRIAVAFLELQAPELPETLDGLAADGIAHIRIAPVFWSIGAHLARDLPKRIEDFRARHPDVRVEVLPVLADLPGISDFLAHALLAQIPERHEPTGNPIAPQAAPSASPGQPLAAAPYLREIGRGKDSARSLSQERAHELMAAILDGRLGELALGAVLIALRMKGEEAAEIAGFLDALEPRLALAPPAAPAWVVVPSYNGARASVNLVPLLTLLLARSGLPVLAHGQESEPAAGARPRVTSAAIFEQLGIRPCANMAEAGAQPALGRPALVALATFAPGLARLLALRTDLGVRNVAHTLAKLVRPVQGPALLLSSYTHPDFGRLQAELFRRTGIDAMSLRGTDGEAVIGARRAQAIDHWRDGQCRTVVAAQAVAAAPADSGLPAPDAASTAAWTRAVLAGQRPAPAALLEQVEAIRAALATPANGQPV